MGLLQLPYTVFVDKFGNIHDKATGTFCHEIVSQLKEKKLGEFSMKVGESYKIKKVSTDSDYDLAIRLMQIGFIEGESLKLIRKAPLFGEPLWSK